METSQERPPAQQQETMETSENSSRAPQQNMADGQLLNQEDPYDLFSEEEAAELFALLKERIYILQGKTPDTWNPTKDSRLGSLAYFGHSFSFRYHYSSLTHAHTRATSVLNLIYPSLLKLSGHEYCLTKELILNQLIYVHEIMQAFVAGYRTACTIECYRLGLAYEERFWESLREQENLQDVYFQDLVRGLREGDQRFLVSREEMERWRRTGWSGLVGGREICAVCGKVRNWRYRT